METNSEEKKYLLILNEKTGEMRIAAPRNEKEPGKVQTAQPDGKPEHFQSFEGRDMVDAYIRNYQRQNEYPQGLKWLYGPLKKLGEACKAFKQSLSEQKTGKDMDPYKDMEYSPRYKRDFDEREMPWGKLEKMGFSKEYLEKSGLAKDLMRGNPTPLMSMDGKNSLSTVDGDFSLRITRNPKNGEPVIKQDGYLPKDHLKAQYKGYNFDDNEIATLLKDKHLGKPVTLKDERGMEYQALVSIHPYTNKVHDQDINKIFLPKVLKEANIEHLHGDFKVGKEIRIDNLKVADGTPYSSNVRWDAFQKKFKFTNPDQKIGQVPEQVGGVKLTKEQQDNYAAGRRVDIGDKGIKKDGKRMSPIIYKNAYGQMQWDRRNFKEMEAHKAHKQDKTPKQGQNAETKKTRQGKTLKH